MVLNSSNTLMNGFDQPAAGIFKETYFVGRSAFPPFGASHTPYDFNLYCDVRSEKLADLDYAASRQQTNAFRISRSNPLNSSALARPPDVVPNTLVRNTTSSPSSSAAGGTDSVAEDGDWQAVGSKKPRPPSYQQMSQSFNHLSILQPHSPLTNSSNFETMVSVLQEKYLLSRPEVIAALQVVRQERNGDMNIPLTELVKDTERLLSKNKNILKPASLTARAKAVPDHEEPCENQLCPARLKQLKYRTELCLSYQTTGKCHMKPGSCVYAHGESEKRPLPKDELCERYLEGKCNNRRCVYAHGASELKNRPIVSTLEYIKTKQKKAIPDKKKPPQEDLSLLESDIDPLGEECSICLDKMAQNSRQKLDCGHDAFHYKCLKKWVAQEGDRSCPLCRSNTLLPEEYPHLGCH
ncbi:hypothetical protein EB796_003740 [Bugula neritina]|uniref:Uncharacterized protein n=1 Tax=Bugula neritina TaxID=10212 RepID=A0A7J7KJZ1_BUGNE|nr:hypothetical protein EB796_003740 [Bugula neritina]